jgi:hypothetical protein
LPDYDSLNSNRISHITVGVFLDDDLHRFHVKIIVAGIRTNSSLADMADERVRRQVRDQEHPAAAEVAAQRRENGGKGGKAGKRESGKAGNGRKAGKRETAENGEDQEERETGEGKAGNGGKVGKRETRKNARRGKGRRDPSEWAESQVQSRKAEVTRKRSR